MMSDTVFNKLKGKRCQKPDTGIDKKHEKNSSLEKKEYF